MRVREIAARIARLEKAAAGSDGVPDFEPTEEELLFLAVLHHEVRKDGGPPSRAPITDEEVAAVEAIIRKRAGKEAR
jgi:hypothetical protein